MENTNTVMGTMEHNITVFGPQQHYIITTTPTTTHPDNLSLVSALLLKPTKKLWPFICFTVLIFIYIKYKHFHIVFHTFYLIFCVLFCRIFEENCPGGWGLAGSFCPRVWGFALSSCPGG